jgi:hypothetical protein
VDNLDILRDLAKIHPQLTMLYQDVAAMTAPGHGSLDDVDWAAVFLTAGISIGSKR